MRIIKIVDSVVTDVKIVKDNYVLQESEMESDIGELNQIRQDDGTFITPETESQEQTTIEEQILAENQYQTALLEMTMMGAM